MISAITNTRGMLKDNDGGEMTKIYSLLKKFFILLSCRIIYALAMKKVAAQEKIKIKEIINELHERECAI